MLCHGPQEGLCEACGWCAWPGWISLCARPKGLPATRTTALSRPLAATRCAMCAVCEGAGSCAPGAAAPFSAPAHPDARAPCKITGRQFCTDLAASRTRSFLWGGSCRCHSQRPQRSSRAGGAARSAPGVAAHYPRAKGALHSEEHCTLRSRPNPRERGGNFFLLAKSGLCHGMSRQPESARRKRWRFSGPPDLVLRVPPKVLLRYCNPRPPDARQPGQSQAETHSIGADGTVKILLRYC